MEEKTITSPFSKEASAQEEVILQKYRGENGKLNQLSNRELKILFNESIEKFKHYLSEYYIENNAIFLSSSEATKAAARLDLKHFDFSDKNLIGTNFSYCNLTGANFSDAILKRAVFLNAILAEADLSGANLSGAELRGAEMRGAILIGINLTGATLIRSNLTGAKMKGDGYDADRIITLENANLTEANLTGTDLRNIRMENTNMKGSNLTHANISGVDFRKVTSLENVDFSMIIYDENTKIPYSLLEKAKNVPAAFMNEMKIKNYHKLESFDKDHFERKATHEGHFNADRTLDNAAIEAVSHIAADVITASNVPHHYGGQRPPSDHYHHPHHNKNGEK